MAIWVDDGIICSFIKDKFQSIINYINNKQCEFTSGPVQCFVGFQIQRDRKNKIIHLSQGTNIEQLLNKFNMSTYHTRVVPSHTHSRLSKALDSPEQEIVSRSHWINDFRRNFHQTWHSIPCKPGISTLQKSISKPLGGSDKNCKLFTRIENLGIGFGSTHQQLVVYSESDYAGVWTTDLQQLAPFVS